MERRFTVDEARAELPAVLEAADEIIELRAHLMDVHDLRRADDPRFNMAELKAGEARLAELIDGFGNRGILVKEWAPLLLDFPSDLDGRPVLLCWLEGERELGWYHELSHGVAGRKRLPA